MAYIERRRQLWYAVLFIPADVREAFSGKRKLIKSLGTPDKREAEILAAPIITDWKIQIRKARGESNPLQREAAMWQRELKKAEALDQLDVVEGLIEDRTRELEDKQGPAVADSFWGLSTGSKTALDERLQQWEAQITLAPKTKDQMVKDVRLLTSRFLTTQEVTKKAVKAWMDEMTKDGKSPASQKRILSFCRNYWKYLQSHDEVPVDAEPFSGVLSFSRAKKATTAGSWHPFAPEDVVTLWTAANEKKDQQLADLIYLGAYTGARIEELCSLKAGDVTKAGALRITDSKTDAGIREVPIHSALTALVTRLKEESEDGYLLSGLTFNKYDDRSNAIGKRFGRLKTEKGFGSSHVFHSIRKTLTTLLENAGVGENFAADIVGHEKPRITYGLYSGGSSLAVKREALEKISYPFRAKPK